MGNRMIVAKKVFWNCSLDITTGSISVFFSSNYTVSRHIIGNFRLLFYSSIYSVNSWFVLINLMKTGIGQSKYCTSQRLSRCLISLCSNLFDFQFSIFFFWLISILFDPTLGKFDRSRFLQWFQALIYNYLKTLKSILWSFVEVSIE